MYAGRALGGTELPAPLRQDPQHLIQSPQVIQSPQLCQEPSLTDYLSSLSSWPHITHPPHLRNEGCPEVAPCQA